MARLALALAALALSLLVAGDAGAGRRAIRVDFGDWSPAAALGSAECPGSAPDSTEVNWNGFVLSASSNPAYLADTYCQSTLEGQFTGDTFYAFGDTGGLGRLVGPNPGQRVTGIRYTFLDRDRFDSDAVGYQWVVYSFPGVALIGFNSSPGFELGADLLIGRRNGEDPEIVPDWRFSDSNSYDGEYFCVVVDPPRWTGDQTQYDWDGSLFDDAWRFDYYNVEAPYGRDDNCIKRLTQLFSDGFEPLSPY